MDELIQRRIDGLVLQVADLWMKEVGYLPPMNLALRIREDFDAHTHALAEKIRSECGCLGGSGTCGLAADLVDSQVANMEKVLARGRDQ